MDQIIIKGLRIFAYHGVNEEEKEKGQPFVIDATMFADLSAAAETDDLSKTVNYARAAKVIKSAMQEQKFDLIEAAAAAVADRLLGTFSQMTRADITLKKPRAPVAADFEYVAVCISRNQKEG